MDHISGFFSRYLSPYLDRERTKEIIAKTCSTVLGVNVSREQITLRKEVCIISGHQSMKHQIFLKQNEILKLLQQNKETSRIYSIQ